MGRNFVKPGFGRKVTRVSHQEGGNLDSADIRLKREKTKPLARSNMPRSTSYPMPSSPGAERTLKDPRATENSDTEKGPFMGSVSSTSCSIGTDNARTVYSGLEDPYSGLTFEGVFRPLQLRAGKSSTEADFTITKTLLCQVTNMIRFQS